MRVAALYDIHGNAPALRAVLDDIRAEQIEMVVVGGDVLPGPQPAEVLDLLTGAGVILRWVRGDGDREPDAWALDRLDPAQRILLETFEPVARVGAALFCHGSPRSDSEGLTRATTEARLRDAVLDVWQPLVVCGHTLQQFDRTAGRKRVANAGAVGLPLEGRAAAFWAVVDRGEIELRRTDYDVEAALAEMRAAGMPGFEALFRDSLIEPLDPAEATRRLETASVAARPR